MSYKTTIVANIMLIELLFWARHSARRLTCVTYMNAHNDLMKCIFFSLVYSCRKLG